MGWTTVLGERIAERRAGVGDARELVGEVHRAALLVPLEGGGLWTAHSGGVRWVLGFTDEAALARFAVQHGPADRSWEFATLLGARILDEIVPAMGGPAGLAVDVATEDQAMFFPPVPGIVPESVAVDVSAGSQGGDARGRR